MNGLARIVQAVLSKTHAGQLGPRFGERRQQTNAPGEKRGRFIVLLVQSCDPAEEVRSAALSFRISADGLHFPAAIRIIAAREIRYAKGEVAARVVRPCRDILLERGNGTRSFAGPKDDRSEGVVVIRVLRLERHGFFD